MIISNSNHLNKKSLSEWFATGFFFNQQSINHNTEDFIGYNAPTIKWHYSPQYSTFDDTLKKFSKLFEELINRKIEGHKIILPLSGGLDSRTLAAALIGKKNVTAFSYEFVDGIKETEYARKIAEVCDWDFQAFKIPRSYLWNKIDVLSDINQCQTEFTHPRQMAVMNEISHLGDLLLSGSMGDLLFDSFNLPFNSDLDKQSEYLFRLITKAGGMEIASRLWEVWHMDNIFSKYLYNRIKHMLREIDIDHPSSRIRSFKVMYYVKNWTNINMKVFSHFNDVYAPYHDNEMCEFVCTIPEDILSGRKLQIEYIKNKSPELARIPWQPYDLDLFNYQKFNGQYFPRRIFRFIKRQLKHNIFKYSPFIERNWELQFLGQENEKYLKYWLFENPAMNDLIPKNIIDDFYNKFIEIDPVKYSHTISMLITLSVWCKRFWKKN